MHWCNKTVVYTPEIVTVEKGEPVEATVIAEGITTLTIQLPTLAHVTVDKRLCELLA